MTITEEEGIKRTIRAYNKTKDILPEKDPLYHYIFAAHWDAEYRGIQLDKWYMVKHGMVA
jgi:hypothetical protein